MPVIKLTKYWFINSIALLSVLLLVQCSTPKKSANIDPELFDAASLPPSAERRFKELFFDASKAKMLGDREQSKTKFLEALNINPNSSTVMFELARIYAEEGNLTTAIEYASNASRKDPGNIWYSEFLGQLYAEAGKLDDSVRIFKNILAANPNQYDYYFHLAGLLMAQGRYDEAMKVYEDLESQVGVTEEVSSQRQLIYMEKGDFDNALKEIDKLIDTNPDEIRYRGMKAELFEKTGRQSEALEIYNEMLELEPDNGLVLLSIYEMNFRSGNAEEAFKYLNRAFLSPELSIDVKVNILLNFMNTPAFRNDASQAIQLGKSLELTHPADAKSYAIQGDVFYNKGMLEESREKFRRAISIDPNRPPIWQQILTINSQLNDFESMSKEAGRAQELFPEQPVFYLFGGIAELSQKKIDDAITTLTTGKNLVVDNNSLLAQFMASLGDAYHENGNSTKSDEHYEQSLKLEPNNPVVLNNYAYYLANRNERLEKAEQMAKKANDLQPNQASFQDTYGWVLFKRNNFQNALFWIEEALKNGAGNDSVVLDHHGDVLFSLKRYTEAVRSWQAAIDAGGDRIELERKINSPTIGE
jgi:tetratricopeptide (TPR) repeat protein